MGGATVLGLILLGIGFAVAWSSGMAAWLSCRDVAEGAAGALIPMPRVSENAADSTSRPRRTTRRGDDEVSAGG
ncbi:hypothetical protein UK23_23785 [Lentzea aerocolonigenes]|uniref:Uncharacterized protein n=1 Tax=Lentzea aerocolonigenes TaxID=68170 RepID=A0A0F0GWF4_LENAE|nr:hypothetical protein [Lentzea aerocolonigenes]KJK46342.1 hypothetical protein UK23_23785 [Lentzea aerocolonigenes]